MHNLLLNFIELNYFTNDS